MEIEPTVGELDRRINRLETTVLGRLDDINRKLDGAVIHRREYDTDHQHIQTDLEDINQRIDDLVNRTWWLAGLFITAALGVAGALITQVLT